MNKLNILSRAAAATFGIAALALLLAPAPAAADQVILDDLIVDGSICVGFDCVNGESFGFDTLRLKENNLRIKFQDTSNSASFPTNDWQITANDSANGGAEKFSIDDITNSRTPFTIEASAPSHSLYVDDGGRIGVGTSTPVVEVHIKDGDTPTLRLEQDGSSGFTPQTWDVAGNETNFFIRDATNGSTLPLRIRPGAASNAIYVNTTSDVGFGTSSPDAGNGANRFIEVKDTTSAAMVVDGGSEAGEFAEFLMEEENTARWSFGYAPNANEFYIFNYTAGGGSGNALTIDDATGDVTIVHDLFITGTCTSEGADCATDFVFDPEYPLETIEEHAEAMFANSYLPGVGPTPDNDGKGAPVKISVFQKTAGILQELEKAHIYIAELNEQVKELRQKLAELDSD